MAAYPRLIPFVPYEEVERMNAPFLKLKPRHCNLIFFNVVLVEEMYISIHFFCHNFMDRSNTPIYLLIESHYSGA